MGIATQAVYADPRLDEVQTTLTRARVAVLRRDRATLEQVLADDYFCVYPDGRILNKADRIRSALSTPAQPASVALLESRDLQARFYDKTCIVIEVIRQSANRQGVPVVDEWVATTILFCAENHWQIVSSQLTAIR